MRILLDSSSVVALLGTLGEEKKLIVSKEIQIDDTLVSSSLLIYEVGNTLLKYRKDSDLYLKSINFFNSLEIEILNNTDLKKTLKIAEQTGLTFYDASFVHFLEKDYSISKFLTLDNDFKKANNPRILILK